MEEAEVELQLTVRATGDTGDYLSSKSVTISLSGCGAVTRGQLPNGTVYASLPSIHPDCPHDFLNNET